MELNQLHFFTAPFMILMNMMFTVGLQSQDCVPMA